MPLQFDFEVPRTAIRVSEAVQLEGGGEIRLIQIAKSRALIVGNTGTLPDNAVVEWTGTPEELEGLLEEGISAVTGGWGKIIEAGKAILDFIVNDDGGDGGSGGSGGSGSQSRDCNVNIGLNGGIGGDIRIDRLEINTCTQE